MTDRRLSRNTWVPCDFCGGHGCDYCEAKRLQRQRELDRENEARECLADLFKEIMPGQPCPQPQQQAIEVAIYAIKWAKEKAGRVSLAEWIEGTPHFSQFIEFDDTVHLPKEQEEKCRRLIDFEERTDR